MVAPHKGAHVVVDALRLALLPPVRLTLFGGLVEPYFRELRASADEVPNLELLAYGGFTPTDLPFLLADIDAVIVPSLVWETYSICTREAFSLGIPVIASRIGSLPEAIRDGENGLLFEPGSAPELAAILHRVASDPRRLSQLRAGIRAGDWISNAERIRRLEGVLAGAVARGARPTEAHLLAELGTMREALTEDSVIA
jgi:glycosyltransferase involved in cell wall biosynthesis